MAEYIERDAVLAERTTMIEYDEGGWDAKVEVVRVKDIKSIPAADVAPVVHGQWVRIQGMAPPEYHGKHRCSVCYARALERKFHEELSDHCPNCGAKMDGE